MSTFADEYLQRKKDKNTSKTEQLTAAPTKNEEDAFATEYISRREQTLQPERYEAKQKQQILTQIDKTRQDYANWKTQADIVEGSGIYIGGNPLQHERVSTIVKEGGLLRPLYEQVSDQDIYYWNLSKMVDGAQKDPKFSEYVQQAADLDALFAREDAAFLKDAMEPEEYDLLKYYAAKDKANGTNLLEDFIYYMEEIWNKRLGEKEAEWYKDKPILGALYGFKSGIDQIGSNLSNLGNMFSMDPDKGYAPQTQSQAASGMIRENLDGFGKFIFDVGSATTNMVPSILLSTAVGFLNPALGAAAGGALMGAGAAGSAYAEKIQAGWTQSEARSYGVMVGASEMALESVLGAVASAAGKGSRGLLSKAGQTGLKKIDDILAKVAKNAAGKIGAEALSEGLEEGVQSILEPYFAHVASGEELTVDMEEALYSALLGAVTGGLFGGGRVAIDTVIETKLTKNEKKVLQAEVDARIKEQQEKLGREMTAKEKSDIEKKVRSELEKGYVTTDRIEEILGGEGWKKYQEAYDREQGVLKDLEGLYQGEELKRQQQAIRDNSVLAGMREELSRGVSESVKGDRFLHESYLEKGRRTEKFTADVRKYKGKQVQIVQKAIDSGVLNNTNRSHELVDLIAKIGADKDIDFDFVNNEKLKESGFALDGVTVNGYVNESGIAINISSQKALNSVVGHEITHVLEGSGMYNELAELVERYANAKTKDGFNTKLKEMISLYQNVEGYKGAEGMAKIRQEAVADLIGDYLFTDEKFLKRLLQEKPNIFRKLWNEIKHLATMATGTEEARRLAEVQKAFETVYRSETKKPTQEGGVKYSLIVKDSRGETTVVNPFAVTEDQIKGYLAQAKKGKLDQYTYFPVSQYTPKSVVETLKNAGIVVEDKPLAMQAKKAKQTQIEGHHTESDGTVIRHHAMSADEIIEAIENLNRPIAAVYQQDRERTVYEDGKKVRVDAPDNCVFFVELSSGKECAVVIEFDSEIPKNSIEIDGNGEEFHTTVTVFEPDQIRDGKEFDYLEYLSTRRSNREIEIKIGNSKTETASGQTEATVPDKESPINRIAQNKTAVNSKKSLSKKETVDNAEGWQIKGEDVLLQQEADANGLVWENGVPFRKDLLELARKRQSGEFSIAPPVPESAKTETAKSQAAANIAPPVPGTETASTVAAETESKVNPKEDAWEGSAPFEVEEATQTPTTVRERTGAKLANLRTELAENQRHRQEISQKFDEEIAKLQERYNGLKNKDTKEAQKLLRQIERQKRLKKDRDAEYAKRISDIEGRVEKLQDFLRQDLTREELVDRQIRKVDEQLENDRAALEEEFAKRREALEAAAKDKDTFIKEQAMRLYRELQGLKKGVKASDDLSYLLDQGYTWNAVKTALLGIHENPGKNLIPQFKLGTMAREMLDQNYENRVYELNNLDAEYLKKLDRLENEAAQKRSAIRTADQRKAKQQQYTEQMEQLVGDTSTWKDKKLGISYRVNTLRRNLRDVVRDAKGNRDIAKADAIYDELQGKYNQNEAQLKRESTEIKSKYADLNITKAEDKYIQMLGELLYNPDTELSEATVQEYLEKHKKQIDEKKVDKVIEMARADYDSLLQRVNEVLREQGMKTIPYRKGYFPHFTEDKQGILGKIFNWKTKNDDIPTDIAGLTEQFSPNRSWQSFNKERTSDTTTYSFLQGMDSYVQGSLDWIHHIEDIQKRRALENYIRYIHSEKGIQERIDAVKSSTELDADEVQEQIDNILKEAKNPLGNFVQDLRTGTNTLAGKKSSLDRGVEGATNRKIYSVMTNLSSRISANMVAGSISSALTNFIPITQSWGQVSPLSSLVAMGDTIKATIRDDGIVNKSDFLTNRLRNPDKLYQGFWDKASEKVGFLMEAVDSFTSQTVWRSKYRENLASGMSESEAIKNADQFAENVLAGRSRGNMPTLFDAKNPIAKMFTAFQLEVNNQYGYMLKDMPQDVKNKSVGRLVAGYAGIFLGAYAYNALYSMLTGRDAAFDPIGIVEDLIRDLNDDDDEPVEDIKGFAENVLQEVPFLGGLMGGGRVPISSALPYDGDIMKAIEGGGKLAKGDWGELTSEWLKPLYYMAAPMGGGQLKKSIGGAAMYLNDKEIKGSYTDSGNLRFPVENDFWSVVQAITMGQWSGENAREYFDEGRKPLTQKQMQEFMDSGMSIHDYWEYRDGLSGLRTMEEKAEYINGLDLTTEQKNLLINNIADRDEKIDMSEYGNYGSLAEYDFAQRYPEKYRFFKDNDISYSDYADADETGKRAYTWAYENPGKYEVSKLITSDLMEYYGYRSDLNDIKADKDEYGYAIAGSTKQKRLAYIAELDLEDGQKYILFKSMYPKDTSLDGEIIDYLLEREDIPHAEKRKILTELGIDLS